MNDLYKLITKYSGPEIERTTGFKFQFTPTVTLSTFYQCGHLTLKMEVSYLLEGMEIKEGEINEPKKAISFQHLIANRLDDYTYPLEGVCDFLFKNVIYLIAEDYSLIKSKDSDG